MIESTLEQVADIVGGSIDDPRDADRVVGDVTIDSRTAIGGSLFVALAGERVDGHDYIAAAMAAGAAGYLYAEGHRAAAEAATIRPRGGVAVDDPGNALLGLGAWVRSSVDPWVVTVTGSSGKTTTKDLLRATIGAGRRVVANPGSYNNELGVPLTCCALSRDTEVLIAEVGARGRGHIAALAGVLEPDVAVVTNVAGAHLEMFGDIAGVAAAKQELVQALDVDGVAILNADDPRVLAMASATDARVVTYGTGADADLRATDITVDALARASFRIRGSDVRLPLPGRHNVANALAALAGAQACGVDLSLAAAALATAAVSPWRMQVGVSDAGVTVLNDAYNANPASMEAALRTLAALDVPGRRWAALGVMAELGETSADAHAAIGRLAAELALDGLVVIGDGAAALHAGAAAAGLDRHGRLLSASDGPDAVAVLRDELRDGDAVLVKASRAAGLETVAGALLQVAR